MEGDILKGICYTEKFTALGSTCNQYVFDVGLRSTKGSIAEAVQSGFNVKVRSVNIIRRDGKMRRNRMKRGAYGTTPRRKIAIVTLQAGDKIEMI
ncbi:MAG: 50S ribosomal protein L23 [Puniceicoccales bacterium]|jgi:large subunit ribosomal protein L23|nr:50S ribosomal protein L23 [Puniceicoccales bacterium]